MCSACEIIVGLPEGIKVNVAQALLREVDVECGTGTLACGTVEEIAKAF
jgi:hypothetical protein